MRLTRSSPVTTDLFAEFAAAESELTVEREHHGQALKAKAIARKTSRITLRRAKSETVLAEVLPAVLEMGMSYHVISHGDVDSLSYLAHIVKTTPLDSLLLSTWCMAMPDLEWLRVQTESWRIGHIDFVLGEIFPSQYPDEYMAVQAMEANEQATMRIAKNRAKVMVGSHAESGLYFAIESSANVNTNPRIEQTAVHMCRELHDHYLEFFAGIKSIDGNRYKKAKP